MLHMMGGARRTARHTSRRTSRRMARRQTEFDAATAPAQETGPPEAAPPQDETPQTKPYVQKLEELAALRDKRIITEEFQAKKNY